MSLERDHWLMNNLIVVERHRYDSGFYGYLALGKSIDDGWAVHIHINAHGEHEVDKWSTRNQKWCATCRSFADIIRLIVEFGDANQA